MEEDISRNKGIWFVKPPDPDDNIVVAGHRFLYSDPISPPFYFLDRVEVGDKIVLQYKGIMYEYSTIRKFVVASKETWIEQDYSFPTVTLYTCTPIYNPVNRLVVVGKLVSIR
jgi:sortase A